MIGFLKIKKFISIVLLLTAGASFVMPGRAQALLVHDPVTNSSVLLNLTENAATAIATGATAVSTALSAAQAGIPGTGAVATTPAATCLPLIAAVDTFDTTKSTTNLLTTLTFGLIGESEFEAVKIEAELKVVGAAKVCVAAYLKGSIGVPSFTQAVADDMIRTQLTFQHLDSVYGERIEQLTARQSATLKQILRAVMLKILQNVEKDLTTRVVNGLIQKFKISNYLQYADALGGQVYAMDYINKNYEGDARQQMMIRQLAQSQLVGQVQGVTVARAFAQNKAEEFLGSNAKGIDFTDPNFYFAMANAGSPDANPEYQFRQAEEQSRQAISAGIANANLEIANGKGFLPPRDCSGSVAEQQALDQKQIDAAQRYMIALQVKGRLVSAKPRPAQSELDKAQAELEAADAAMKALPQEVSKPVVEICKAIENPGGAVADQITGFLNKHLSESTDFKPENLPFFASFLSDVASNFITNIVTGGKSSGKMLTELGLGVLNSAVASTINTTTNPPTTVPTGTGTTPPPSGNDNGGGGGGQTTPATCEPESNNGSGIRLSCDSLPTTASQPFTININLSGLPSDVVPEELLFNSSDGTVYPPERAPISSIVKDSLGNYKFLVDKGITKRTRFAFAVVGKKNGQYWNSLTAGINVTPPTTGQVQGFSTQKLSLRSFAGPGLIIGRPGITLR